MEGESATEKELERGTSSMMEEEGKSAHEETDALIAGLPTEVALSILARLPSVLYPRLRSVCRAWNGAFRPSGSVVSCRRTLGMLQAWPLIGVAHRWYALDPHHLSPHRIPSPRLFSNMEELSGSEHYCGFAMYRSKVHDGNLIFHAFDASGMQWQKFQLPGIPPGPSSFIIYAILDDYLYAVGGHSLYGPSSVDRIHIGNLNMLSSSSWEGIRDMHHPRAWGRVIPRQGCLYVLGGRSLRVYPWSENYSGEVWNPRTKEWTLVPQLWPFKVFGDHQPSEISVAVAMGALFALKTLSRELLCYHDGKQEWVNVGQVPVESNRPLHRLIGVGRELWFFARCDRKADGADDADWFEICISDVAALSGSLFDTPPNLWWRVLRSKFDRGVDVFEGNVVHV